MKRYSLLLAAASVAAAVVAAPAAAQITGATVGLVGQSADRAMVGADARNSVAGDAIESALGGFVGGGPLWRADVRATRLVGTDVGVSGRAIGAVTITGFAMVDVVAAVRLLAAWALMILGTGAIGIAMRRQKHAMQVSDAA